MLFNTSFATAGAIALLLANAPLAHAAGTMSDADKTFVGMVSQGGMYEVELGKVAEKQGATQDIRDQGNTETHDHTLVGDKLKGIVTGAGMEFPSKLNETFQARLDKISALSGDAFDKAYLADMKKIHDADGAAFAKEAKGGTNPDLKAFAAETHRIVERHLGEIEAKTH
jgi:putative membrane protein